MYPCILGLFYVSMYRFTFVARTYRIRELTAAAGAGADTRSGPVSYALII